MVLFTRCCCCFRLNTGGLILGWLGIIVSLGILYKIMDESKIDQLRFISETSRCFYISAFVLIGIYLAASVALLNGCRDLNHYLLLPWMICEILAMVYSMSLSLQSLIIMYSDGYYYTDSKLAINILNVILIFMRVYWWMCVESYYELLKNQRLLLYTVQFPEEESPGSEKLCQGKKLENMLYNNNCDKKLGLEANFVI